MNALLQNFVESLRDELKQYGELLALLEAQQEQVIRRLADDLLETVSTINAQGNAIQVARRERTQRQREVCQGLNLPAESPIAALIPALPEVYRPLVSALLEENNHLLRRVRQRARQNHILLSRSLELMDKFINSFCAVGAPTYDETGTMTPRPAPRRALYEEIC